MRKPRHREDNLPEVALAVSGNPGLQSVRTVTRRTHVLHGAVNFMCQHDSVTGCPGMASTRLQVCLQAVPSGIRTRMGGLSGAIALPRGWAPPGPGEGRRTRPLCRLPALDIRSPALGLGLPPPALLVASLQVADCGTSQPPESREPIPHTKSPDTAIDG